MKSTVEATDHGGLEDVSIGRELTQWDLERVREQA